MVFGIPLRCCWHGGVERAELFKKYLRLHELMWVMKSSVGTFAWLGLNASAASLVDLYCGGSTQYSGAVNASGGDKRRSQCY